MKSIIDKVYLKVPKETCKALGGKWKKYEGLCEVSGKVVSAIEIETKIGVFKWKREEEEKEKKKK